MFCDVIRCTRLLHHFAWCWLAWVFVLESLKFIGNEHSGLDFFFEDVIRPDPIQVFPDIFQYVVVLRQTFLVCLDQ